MSKVRGTFLVALTALLSASSGGGVVQAAPTRFTSPTYGIESVIFGGTGTLRSSEASIPPVITAGPTAASITTTTVLVSWVTDKASNSVVLYGLTSGVYDQQTGQIDQATDTQHQVKLSGLTRGKTYYYRVHSTDVAGNLTVSPEATFATDPGDTIPPNLRSGPTLAFTSSTSASVTWETDELASSQIEYGIGAVTENVIGSSDELTLFHQVQINGLRPAQGYVYRVRSKDASGNLYTGVINSLTSPNAPSITNVKISDITLNSAVVEWQTTVASTSLVSYGTASGSYTQTISDDTFTNNHTFRLTGLANGTTYYLQITAQDSSGNKYRSDEYLFKTVVLPLITKFSVTQVTATSATLSWDSSSDIDELVRYSIVKNEDPALVGKGYSAGSEKLVSHHSYQLSDLESNTEYSVSVLGKDVFGNAALSANESFSTLVDHVPPAILNVKSDTTVDLGSKQTVQVLVSFGLSKKGHAVIEYGTGASGPYTKKVETDTDLSTNKFMVIPSLTPGESYHFHIVATDKNQNHSESPDYLVLAPSQPVSLYDLIFGQIRTNFGWLSKLGSSTSGP